MVTLLLSKRCDVTHTHTDVNWALSTFTYQWMKWPRGKTARGSGSSDRRWGSVCTWSPLRVQTCWAGWASRWGCTWYCTCWAHPGWWSLWHSPGKGTAGSGRETPAGCWGAGCPRTLWRCPARGQIPRLSSQSWCGVLPGRWRRLEGSCWGRSSPNWSRSARGTLTGTCWSPLEDEEKTRKRVKIRRKLRNHTTGWYEKKKCPVHHHMQDLCEAKCVTQHLQNGSWMSSLQETRCGSWTSKTGYEPFGLLNSNE